MAKKQGLKEPVVTYKTERVELLTIYKQGKELKSELNVLDLQSIYELYGFLKLTLKQLELDLLDGDQDKE